MTIKGKNVYKKYIESHLANDKIKYHSVYEKSYGEVKIKSQDYIIKSKWNKIDITV